jgi:hypothetical protein
MLQENYEVKPQGATNQRQNRGLIEEITDLKSSFQAEENGPSGSSGEGEGSDENPDETISTVLALLGSIMELGSFKRDEKEEKILRSLILPALQSIASGDGDCSLSEMASDVALMIMVRGENGKRKRKSDQPEPASQIKGRALPRLLDSLPQGTSTLSKLLREVEIDLRDSEPPIRAYGIKRVISFLRSSEQVLPSSSHTLT